MNLMQVLYTPLCYKHTNIRDNAIPLFFLVQSLLLVEQSPSAMSLLPGGEIGLRHSPSGLGGGISLGMRL